MACDGNGSLFNMQAAKSLGKTVRAIKPDLDEFMNTATELKSQVDESLGIDEIKRSFQTTGVSVPGWPCVVMTFRL